MTVSNEDREAAIDIAYDAADAKHDRVHRPYSGCCSVVGIAEAVDALVSHGWGPKAAINAVKLDERISNGSHACRHCPKGEEEWVLHPLDVVEIVRECGIEVTD